MADNMDYIILYWVGYLQEKTKGGKFRIDKMAIIPEPTKVKLELMSNEIEAIIDELGRVQHDIFEHLNYKDIIKKLNKALEVQG